MVIDSLNATTLLGLSHGDTIIMKDTADLIDVKINLVNHRLYQRLSSIEHFAKLALYMDDK